MNITKANQDIRDYMADHGVTQRMLASAMGTSAFTINKRLKTELSQKEKEEWMNQIDAIESDSNESVAETDETVEESSPYKFQIGDRVKIPSKANKVGIVTDIWSSLAKSAVMYAVENEDDGYHGMYSEDQLELAPLPVEYRFEVTIEDNAAVVVMFATQGEKTWVYARGHAHILHDGEIGMAQAVSYASKRMFASLDRTQDNPVYFK